MKLKHYWAVVVLLYYCSCSYSEIKNETSKNAASGGMTWSMQNVLPYSTGLTVDGVIYQYTSIKNKDDPMGVTIQNYNLSNDGFVFRNRDDWSGLRGNTITKLVPVDNIPGNLWGSGEIKVDGVGKVENYAVFYKYRYDMCVINILSSPSCPGYAEAILKTLKIDQPIIITDETKNQNEISVLCLPTDVVCLDNKLSEKGEQPIRSKKDKDNKSNANLLLNKKDTEIALQLEAMSAIPDLYKTSMSGGTYKDVPNYPEKSLPDSVNRRRLGLAQEKLHQSMVDMQYDIGK